MTNSKRLVALAVSAALGAPLAAHATNGMNMAGYGPIATAMGGASMAYDNGTAGMMNNPATLGLMANGENRLDLAWGNLGPDVKTNGVKSSGTSYAMPAGGWARKSGRLAYGVGVFAQGGMGTQYPGDPNLSGKTTRSEVGVGRVMLPLAYDVNKNFTVGGSIDWVRATMDLQMDVPGSYLKSSANGGLVSSATGQFANFVTAWDANTNVPTWGRFSFSDSSDWTGAAKGSGFAAKIGFVYQVNPALSIGGTYHSETSLGDLKVGNASLSMAGPNPAIIGSISVKDFQWPETYGLGLAYHPSKRWMVAADVKVLNWKKVMKNFKMTFSNATYGTLNVEMPQNWKNQTVFELGGAYNVTDNFTVRAGANLSNNPIPDSTVNPLFPAIIKDHYMLGFGYDFNKANVVNASITFAPKVTVTNSTTGAVISHSQTNWQLMYSHMF